MGDMERYRIMVVDDSPIIRSGLTTVLEASNDLEIVGEAGDSRRAVDLAWQIKPDVVLSDMPMPEGDGITSVAMLSEVSRVIILTYADDPDMVLSAIRSGAIGYLVHDTFTVEELTDAIRDTVRSNAHPLSPTAAAALVTAAKAGQCPCVERNPGARREHFGLSARETDVMNLIAQGHTNSSIAAQLFLAEKSVKNYINRIYAKMEAQNRATAIVKWLGIRPDTAIEN
ncbi:DNA-binding response regulator, NarL/FixJ family, contains REC and HTH domains [Thermomonospora echinospora]|uniref:DNA-binding response regulator, NarL/FixJ family, contains REC and HTH domains n=1 Tax=Thermomonospora echinospora TaxID=1992 RepID=A0A1H6D1F2_9ACTN|nr:response regulator transcription factor [Thermomonospora echinospora]SEG78848.1 DNA-binding response regulator, NarL/FixJ family, contains REC and HTH domains [Thermomonospora echinospora]